MTRSILDWGLAIAASVAVAIGLGAAHVPTPALLGAVVGGVAVALVLRRALDLSPWAIHPAQGIVGVASGAYMRSSTLAAVGVHWLPVLLVCLATLVLSLLLGLAFATLSSLDRPTASVGLIAGGAAGIVSVARELGADDRVVVVLQYLRVLLVVTFMPLVAAALFHASSQAGGGPSASPFALTGAWFAVLCLALGLPLGSILRVPAGALIGPMLVAATLAVAGVSRPVPGLLQNLAFGVVGLQVGLRFTASSLQAVGSVLPLATIFIVVLVAVCALLGLALARFAHVTELDGYLATTPGGLYVVAATAVSGSANIAFVLSVQLLRTFVMLLAAPPIVRRLVGRPVSTGVAAGAEGGGGG